MTDIAAFALRNPHCLLLLSKLGSQVQEGARKSENFPMENRPLSEYKLCDYAFGFYCDAELVFQPVLRRVLNGCPVQVCSLYFVLCSF